MAKQIVQNGDTGLLARTKINDNFAELYDDTFTRISSVATVAFDENYMLVSNDGSAVSDSLATLSFTGAVEGSTFVVQRHNSGSIPLPSGANVLNIAGSYKVGQDNYIKLTYVGKIAGIDKVVGEVYAMTDYETLINDKEPILGLNETHKGMLSGKYYDLMNPYSVTYTTYGSANGSIRFFPFMVTEDITFDEMGLEVTTAGTAGAVTRLGIFETVAGYYPITLVPGSDIGEYPSDSIGKKLLTPATPILLQRNKVYCFAVHTSQTISYRAQQQHAHINLLGKDLSITTSNQGFVGRTLSRTYQAMPTTMPAGGTLISAAQCPLIYLRKQ